MMRRVTAFSFFLLAILFLLVTRAAGDSLQTAQQQFAQGQFAAAVKTLEAALAQEPQDAALHYWLGRCYYELRDVDRAFLHAERAVQLDPQNSDYHLWLGHACGRKARRESSLSLARRTKREFEEAVRLNPSSIPARRALLDYLSQSPWIAGGDDGEARRQAEAVVALDPAEGHLAWADYWINNNAPARAVAEFQRVLELKPNRIEPYMEVLSFYAGREDAAQLEKALAAAERVSAADPRLDFYRGVVWTLKGTRLNEAEQALQKYLSTVTPRRDFPSHASAHEWLARLYEREGKLQQAIEQYRLALSKDTRRKSARDALKRLQR
jgi:tetratricopeptide (TPR) repeat protein